MNNRMHVVRCGSLWLGRGGKHLTLCLTERLEDASVYSTSAAARKDAGRAEQILGVLCEVESRACAELGVTE